MKNFKFFSLIMGVLLLVCGFMLLDNPMENVIALAIFIGIVMFLSGISEVIWFFSFKSSENKPWWLLFTGILSVLAGLLVTFNKQELAIMSISLPIFFAMWVVLAGIMRMAGSITSKKIGYNGWWVGLLTGIIGVILGVLLIMNPFSSVAVLGYMVAFTFIYQGTSSIIHFFINRNFM